MQKVLLNMTLTCLAICLCACSSDVVRESSEFLKQKDALPWFSRCRIYDINGQEAVLFSTDDGFATIDTETKKVDTLVKGISKTIREFCYNPDGTIFARLESLVVWDSRIDEEIHCPPTKYHGEPIIWTGIVGYEPFFSYGNILYTGFLLSFDSNADFADFRKKASLIAAWDISNPDSVRCVKIFGKRPSDQPKDMFIDDCYQTAFNVEDSIIVAGTELSQNVVVMTMSGKTLREKKLSSKFYVKPEKKDFSQNHSATEKIKYWEENMLFRGLFYDKYRKLYYRILQLPKQEDKSSFTKRKQDWVLIVADSKLNKKYEVKFDGDKYRWAILIGKQGVYVLKDKTMDLFVFD